MASTGELLEIPQVFPGTMLRVEEGQVFAVLCASEDNLSNGSAAGQQHQSHLRTKAALRSGTEPGARSTSVLNAAQPASGAPPGPFLRDAATEEPDRLLDEDEDYEDDFADGAATATFGDGSSSNGDETETFSELSDPGGTEVVFVREGVAVWPGARAERIPGRLSLVKQCNVLFMAWLPYSRGVLQGDGTFRVTISESTAAPRAPGGNAGTSSDTVNGATISGVIVTARSAGDRGGVAGGCGGSAECRADAEAFAHSIAPGRDRTLYAVHPIPLSEVKALRRRMPPLGFGCPSLVVVLTSGVTLPPLYFQRGGVKALINTLKQHTFLLKSADDPNTYLVNDTADPLSRSLSALQLSDVLIGGPPPGASATFKPGESVLAPAPEAPNVPPPPLPQLPLRGPAAWVTPALGLGLAAVAGLGGGGGRSGGGGSGIAGARIDFGLGMGMGLGLGSAVPVYWADQSASAPEAAAVACNKVTAAAAGPGGFEAVEGGRSDGEDDNGDTAAEDVEDELIAAARSGAGRQANVWAYGIVDAINRFVQNVRGTASGWIGALDELDDQDGNLYDNYDATPYGEAEPTAAAIATAAALHGSESAARQLDEKVMSLSAGVGTAQSASCSGGNKANPAGLAAPAAAPAAPQMGSTGSASAAPSGASDVNTSVGDFELLDSGGCWGDAAAHPQCRRRVRPPPLSPEEWVAMFDAEGRLVVEAALRDRVYLSGCASELRREVWKHLLGMYPRGSTAAQRAEIAKKWQADYRTLRQQWQSMVPAQEARCGSWRCHRAAVDKDVRRTDRAHPFFAREGCAGLRALRNVLLTHVVYDRDLGYCQGMSDLAAPLLMVMRDEAEAFWTFAVLMERLAGNFHSDLQGMTLQLEALRRLVQLVDPPLHAYFERRDCLSYYFSFRWLLILFKREFKFDEVLSLWEACWACRRTRHLHLYLAAAVFVQHRRVILSSVLDFDGMLRLCIGLAGRLELQTLLETAEALVGYAGEAGREVTSTLPC